jgi:hypothetical protein
MHFVPLFYDDADQFRAARWSNTEGLSAFEHLDELGLGEDVVIQVAICGTGQQDFVRGTVIWKRTHDDTHLGVPAAAGVRIVDADRARLAALAKRVDRVAPPQAA